jgi:hypothetical protein
MRERAQVFGNFRRNLLRDVSHDRSHRPAPSIDRARPACRILL